MSDWLTIRVELSGSADLQLDPLPGRIMLVGADHTLAELGEAINVAFGRWDLTPLHTFESGGRAYAPGEVADEAGIDGDSDDVTVGELRLRPGSLFTYTFDLGEEWVHRCRVLETGDEELADNDPPERPVPVYGWGVLPDQYGVDTDEDADAEDAWDGAFAADWGVVEDAIGDIERLLPTSELATAVLRLRGLEEAAGESTDLLWAAADLGDDVPSDDAELWVELAAGVVEPAGDDLGVDAEREAAWTGIDPADWAGAVIELVRAGVGQATGPDELMALVARCAEVESADMTDDDAAELRRGWDVVVGLWEALGAVDDARRLTPLGLWGLPLALRLAWSEIDDD